MQVKVSPRLYAMAGKTSARVFAVIQPLSDVYRPILGGFASSVHTPDEPALSLVSELVSVSGELRAGSSIILHLPAGTTPAQALACTLQARGKALCRVPSDGGKAV